MTRESSGRVALVANWTDSAAVGNTLVPKEQCPFHGDTALVISPAVFHDFEAFLMDYSI